ncbi:unnamed protein product [Linum trigynum]|uniref:Retrotransposon gag domain-containing protein n=1 Tax=Linum trigynum TaxID=586398 RepID=A0AAV2GLJ8_9ROSI
MIWPTSSCTGNIQHRRPQRSSGRSLTSAKIQTSHFVMHGSDNFEVSTSVITMLRGSVVFCGKEGECPRSHLRRFHELIDGIKINGVPADAIQLRYFPFTLEWLDTRPPGSITTFANLADKFLTRYHPLSKTADLQNQITHFAQDEDETIRDAWERYTSLFLKCPNHGFTDTFKVGTF